MSSNPVFPIPPERVLEHFSTVNYIEAKKCFHSESYLDIPDVLPCPRPHSIRNLESCAWPLAIEN